MVLLSGFEMDIKKNQLTKYKRIYIYLKTNNCIVYFRKPVD